MFFSIDMYNLINLGRKSLKKHYFQIDTVLSDKKIFKVLAISPLLMPQQPEFYIEFNSLNTIKRGPHKENSCEDILNLFRLFRKSCSL